MKNTIGIKKDTGFVFLLHEGCPSIIEIIYLKLNLKRLFKTKTGSFLNFNVLQNYFFEAKKSNKTGEAFPNVGA